MHSKLAVNCRWSFLFPDLPTKKKSKRKSLSTLPFRQFVIIPIDGTENFVITKRNSPQVMSILAVRFLHPISYGQVVCRISAAKAPAAAGKRTFLLCCTHNNNTPHNPTCLPTTWPRFATGKRFLLTTCSYLHARVVAILETPYICHLSLSLSSRRCCKQPGWESGKWGGKVDHPHPNPSLPFKQWRRPIIGSFPHDGQQWRGSRTRRRSIFPQARSIFERAQSWTESI